MKKLIAGMLLALFSTLLMAATLPPIPRGQKPKPDPRPCLTWMSRIPCPVPPLPPVPKTGK